MALPYTRLVPLRPCRHREDTAPPPPGQSYLRSHSYRQIPPVSPSSPRMGFLVLRGTSMQPHPKNAVPPVPHHRRNKHILSEGLSYVPVQHRQSRNECLPLSCEAPRVRQSPLRPISSGCSLLVSCCPAHCLPHACHMAKPPMRSPHPSPGLPPSQHISGHLQTGMNVSPLGRSASPRETHRRVRNLQTLARRKRSKESDLRAIALPKRSLKALLLARWWRSTIRVPAGRNG